MNLPALPLVDGCLFIDNSGFIEPAQRCYRELQYSKLNKRIGIGERPALSFGSAVHLGTELRYVRYKNQKPGEEFKSLFSDLIRPHFEEHPTPEGDWRTLNWCTTVMERYNERYEREPFNLLQYDSPIQCPYCVPDIPGERFAGRKVQSECIWCQGTGKRETMVEMSFALPLFTYEVDEGVTINDDEKIVEIPIIYTGRIDLPISIDNRIFIMDHKTSGQLGSLFWDSIRLSAQQRGYCWAFEQLTGRKVQGYYVNGIRTKEAPAYVTDTNLPLKGKKYSPDQWWLESFGREHFFLKDGDLEEWKTNTIDKVEEFFWHYSRDYLPMNNPTGCVKFGRCQYYDVCTMPKADRDLTISDEARFTDNNWSPLQVPDKITNITK